MAPVLNVTVPLPLVLTKVEKPLKLVGSFRYPTTPPVNTRLLDLLGNSKVLAEFTSKLFIFEKVWIVVPLLFFAVPALVLERTKLTVP